MQLEPFDEAEIGIQGVLKDVQITWRVPILIQTSLVLLHLRALQNDVLHAQPCLSKLEILEVVVVYLLPSPERHLQTQADIHAKVHL